MPSFQCDLCGGRQAVDGDFLRRLVAAVALVAEATTTAAGGCWRVASTEDVTAAAAAYTATAAAVEGEVAVLLREVLCHKKDHQNTASNVQIIHKIQIIPALIFLTFCKSNDVSKYSLEEKSPSSLDKPVG